MAYDPTDPRASLAGPATAPQTGLVAEEQIGLFGPGTPCVDEGGVRSWHLRGANFILVWTEAAAAAAELPRHGQPDEYVILLPDPGTRAVISWQGERTELTGPQIAFVPPGDSGLSLPQGGRVARLFTSASRDLLALSSNADGYDRARPHIPPFAPWPDPPEGWKIRAYALDVAPQPGRFGRIFRCTTFMVNVLDPAMGPRDPAKLSPHHHDDFEQCSLALSGRFLHHLRWPWTTDLADWKPDLHLDMSAPSALIIPPPVIHTSQAMEAGRNELVDVFCPPRLDFSLRPGWVLNGDDYPLLPP